MSWSNFIVLTGHIMNQLSILLHFLASIHLGYGFFANLCFNERKTLNCSHDGPLYVGGKMTVLSVTLLLSKNSRALNETALNRGTCKSVDIDCQVVVRPSSERSAYHASMLDVSDYIISTCTDKVSCTLTMPHFESITGTHTVCQRTYPDVENFHLRGAFLDIGCAFPQATTTPKMEQVNITNHVGDRNSSATDITTSESPATTNIKSMSSPTTKPVSSGTNKDEKTPITRQQLDARSESAKTLPSYQAIICLIFVSMIEMYY